MNTNGETRNEQMTMAAIQNMAREQPTLRDHLAMSALIMFGGGSWNGVPDKYVDTYGDDMALKAYKMADKMIMARTIKY